MHSILDLFEQTFEDHKLSTAEKKALHEILGEKDLKFEQIGFLRNRIFEFARNELKSHTAIEVLKWVEQANKVLLKYQKQEHKPDEVYFSPGEKCRQAITRFLREAKKTLDICVFTISDNQISDVILECHRNRIKVRVISDDDKTFDKGSDIFKLRRRGLPIKVDDTPNHMHHKFAIADGKAILTGSYNWTRSAAAYNHENILITYKPSVIKHYSGEFNRLWKEFNYLKC